MPSRVRVMVVAAGLAFAAGPAQAQLAAPAPAPLSTRILHVEDARLLSTDAQAVLVEGTKDRDPRLRVQAVRAMGRFESPALLGHIIPLLSDNDPAVRQAAAIAAANAAKVFPTQAIQALTRALDTSPPADWAVFAASLGRIAMTSGAEFTAAEQAIAAGLPPVVLRAQVVRPARPAVRPTDPVRVEGAARGLEALVRVNGTLGSLSADTRSRLFAVVEVQPGASARHLARARRLALLALRNARAVDGDLAGTAAKDPDDEVRRLAMTAVAAPAATDGASIAEADREAVLRAGLKDPEPRVRLEALRGWGRHRQQIDCQPIVAAVSDASTHVALQAIDLLGAGCPAATPVAPLLQTQADSLPASGATWHRAAHAVVALARVAPAETRLVLPRFVGHPTWQVRMYAARAAGQMAAIEPLVRLGSDAHDNVREAALEELTRLKRAEALPIAYDALRRPDFQLRMTAARALAAETDRAKAAAALLGSLDELTAQGHDTSRDPRVAILTTLTAMGTAAEVPRLERLLEDWDPRVAELAAKAITQWSGTPRQATPKPRQHVPPDPVALAAVRGRWLRITMAGGGVIDLRLLADDAAATVLRVTGLATIGYYNGLTFHRVEPTFVLQGGSPGANEFMGDGLYMRDEPGLAHNRGTLGISTRGRDTGDAQIFINLVDSPRLDHAYTVFAVVERGMDVADRVLEGDVMTRVELVDAPRR
ncbi:MAG: HEAT repeat domain-containing protein [Vicinamibacterales bacterium]